jgi:uncharacterized protein (DUF4415 family)
MRKASTKTNSAKQIRLSNRTKEAYRRRNTALDQDKDAPQLPLEYWQNATVGKYFRPRKTQISFRIDNEILDWLKSKGEGHLSRINDILRERMTREKRAS